MQEANRRAARLLEREAAQAIEEIELVVNEPVTVVLSTGGFVRSAKGHEIDPRNWFLSMYHPTIVTIPSSASIAWGKI